MEEIRLKEGEEIKVQADNNNEYAFAILVNYKGCIIHKGQADCLKGIK